MELQSYLFKEGITAEEISISSRTEFNLTFKASQAFYGSASISFIQMETGMDSGMNQLWHGSRWRWLTCTAPRKSTDHTAWFLLASLQTHSKSSFKKSTANEFRRGNVNSSKHAFQHLCRWCSFVDSLHNSINKSLTLVSLDQRSFSQSPKVFM